MTQQCTDLRRICECGDKHPFPSWWVAYQVAERQGRRRKQPRDVYRCHWCRRWHIGGRFGPRRKAGGDA